MSQVPNELKYAITHEWARLEKDGTISIGITDHAQHALGDLVFVELPEVGGKLSAGDECAVVESVKAASDVYSPVSGEIVAVNAKLNDQPDLINHSPYTDGWIFRVKPEAINELDKLLNANAYAEKLGADED